MALLMECPQCKKRNSLKVEFCKCGLHLKKQAHKIYWIDYYVLGNRKRERIGSSKAAAEQRLREVLTLRTEDRYIHRNKNIRVMFNDLAKWYLELPQIKAKRSYSRDVLSIRTLKSLFAKNNVSELTPNRIEAYRQKTLNPSLTPSRAQLQ